MGEGCDVCLICRRGSQWFGLSNSADVQIADCKIGEMQPSHLQSIHGCVQREFYHG